MVEERDLAANVCCCSAKFLLGVQMHCDESLELLERLLDGMNFAWSVGSFSFSRRLFWSKGATFENVFITYRDGNQSVTSAEHAFWNRMATEKRGEIK